MYEYTKKIKKWHLIRSQIALKYLVCEKRMRKLIHQNIPYFLFQYFDTTS